MVVHCKMEVEIELKYNDLLKVYSEFVLKMSK